MTFCQITSNPQHARCNVSYALSMTFADSISVNESSFSCLKRTLTQRCMSMLYQRKADLKLIAFESQLAFTLIVRY